MKAESLSIYGEGSDKDKIYPAASYGMKRGFWYLDSFGKGKLNFQIQFKDFFLFLISCFRI